MLTQSKQAERVATELSELQVGVVTGAHHLYKGPPIHSLSEGELYCIYTPQLALLPSGT